LLRDANLELKIRTSAVSHHERDIFRASRLKVWGLCLDIVVSDGQTWSNILSGSVAGKPGYLVCVCISDRHGYIRDSSSGRIGDRSENSGNLRRRRR